jgi:L-2,4-diaminobutyric acid acetyltransferase
MSEKRSLRVGGGTAMTEQVSIETPDIADGAAIWRIARDSEKLDLNSSYSYLLWCRDFDRTSVVARVGGDPVGFVTGYLRPGSEDTLLVWQVAVDPAHQGRGLAGMLLDGLLTRLVDRGVRFLETTVTPDNEPSNRMFRSLAERWSVPCERTELFASDEFPDGHDAEFLYRLGPFRPA